MTRPSRADFDAVAASGLLVPVWREMAADLLTPLAAWQRLAVPDRGAFLLESVVGGQDIARYSFVGADPIRRVRAGPGPGSRDPRALGLGGRRGAALPGLPPFTGGWVGYAAYDLVREREPVGPGPREGLGLPDLAFDEYRDVVVFDHARGTVRAVANAAAGGYEAALARIGATVERLAGPGAGPSGASLPEVETEGLAPARVDSRFAPGDFLQAVERVLDYIRAGDVFQAVLSRRLSAPLAASAVDVYRALRAINPSPYMFLLDTGEAVLVGASPEVLVRVTGGRARLRPIAGTRPRGADPVEDARLARELAADPKERAEHAMLVDLGRNDLGRVSAHGSVRVEEAFALERYSHVMHLVSALEGHLAPGRDSLDALAACLPAGTVSGAPKVRAMQVIDELEPERRGPYAGAVGYLAYGGDLDTCIAIRTLVLCGGRAYAQAGAGVVADSDPARELQETEHKALALLAALTLAERLSRPMG